MGVLVMEETFTTVEAYVSQSDGMCPTSASNLCVLTTSHGKEESPNIKESHPFVKFGDG
jgi:hypothetical protein